MAVVESYYKTTKRQAKATGRTFIDPTQLDKVVTKYAGRRGKVDGFARGQQVLAQPPQQV